MVTIQPLSMTDMYSLSVTYNHYRPRNSLLVTYRIKLIFSISNYPLISYRTLQLKEERNGVNFSSYWKSKGRKTIFESHRRWFTSNQRMSVSRIMVVRNLLYADFTRYDCAPRCMNITFCLRPRKLKKPRS